jgi:hypothetical protein
VDGGAERVSPDGELGRGYPPPLRRQPVLLGSAIV